MIETRLEGKIRVVRCEKSEHKFLGLSSKQKTKTLSIIPRRVQNWR